MFKLFTRWATKTDTQADHIDFHLKSGNLGLTYLDDLVINGKSYKFDWSHITTLNHKGTAKGVIEHAKRCKL